MEQIETLYEKLAKVSTDALKALENYGLTGTASSIKSVLDEIKEYKEKS